MMIDLAMLREAYALADRAQTRVRTNFVESIDGAITRSGVSGTLGGASDRALMSVLRAMADVVLVGAGTTRIEGYGGLSLDAEARQWRESQGLSAEPRLAVVSRRLDLDPDAPLFAEAQHPPLIVTCEASPASQREALSAVADVVVCGDDAVDLALMLREFARCGWTQVLCEGGPHLFGSLLDAQLVDEVCVTVSPQLVGGAAGRMVQGAGETAHRLDLVGSIVDDDGFVFLRYRR